MTVTDRQIRGVPGYVAVVSHLKREVSLGRLLPGDRLPPERRLAEQFGVARETLRQALRILEEEGVIVIARGASGGAVIQDVSMDLEEYRRQMSGRRDAVMNLLDYRLEIEASATRIATLVLSEARDENQAWALDALAKMQAAQDEMVAADNKYEFRRADTEFHLAIAAATRNPHFMTAVEDVRSQLFRPFDVFPFEIALSSSHRSHDRILSAIDRGLPELAAGEMRDHIDVTRKELLHLMSE